MGTNYYCRIIPSHERRKQICDLIMESNDFDEIRNEVIATFGSLEYDYNTQSYQGGVIHIGKKSGGWKFLWDPNIYELHQGHSERDETNDASRWVQDPSKPMKLYELTKKSIKEFIFRDDVLVYDEYGDIQDKDEFWKFALSTKGTDAVSYYKEQKEKDRNYHEYSCYNDYVKFLESIGYEIEFPYHDFYSDGLRFATCAEFS